MKAMATKITMEKLVKREHRRRQWRHFCRWFDKWIPPFLVVMTIALIITHLKIFQQWIGG